MTAFIRSVGNGTHGVWKFLDKAYRIDAGVRLAELQHSSFNKVLTKCAGRTPIYVHPSFYRSLKVQFPLEVGGLSRSGRVTTKLGTGSLRQTIGILTPEDFRLVVDTELVSRSVWSLLARSTARESPLRRLRESILLRLHLLGPI